MSGRWNRTFSTAAWLGAFGMSLAALRCQSSDAGSTPDVAAGGALATGGSGGAAGAPGSAGGAIQAAGGTTTSSNGGASSTGGTLSAGGATAHVDASTGAGGALDDSIPARTLAETGLYSDAAQTQLSAGVTLYEVRDQLWADGATKKRYLSLPPGQPIDTTDPDAWVFPIGTKIWKEFTRDGVRVETRLIQKSASGQDGWKYVAFAWNAAQTEAVATPLGATSVLGTPHDIPTQTNCFGCHMGSPDFVLGVSAFGLPYDGPGLTLSSLASSGQLSKPIAKADVTIPGDAKAQAALGVLNANCGTSCHRPGTFAFEKSNLELRLKVGVSTVQQTPAYVTAVNVAVGQIFENVPMRITPGSPSASAVYTRMTSRTDTIAMPDIGTKVVDTAGSAIVADWITSLKP